MGLRFGVRGKIAMCRATNRITLGFLKVKPKTSVYGSTLLAGILWCVHCYHKLVGCYCYKQLKTYAYYRPIYRCYNGSTDAKECDGQTIYSAKKIETVVPGIIHDYNHSFQASVNAILREQARRQIRSKVQTQIREYERNLEVRSFLHNYSSNVM